MNVLNPASFIPDVVELNNAEINLLAGLAWTTASCYTKVAGDESDPREKKRIEEKAAVYYTIHAKLVASFKSTDTE